MITQQTADKAKNLLKITSRFDWRDDPEHPDFGSKDSVDRRKWLVEMAWCQHPLERLSLISFHERFELRSVATATDIGVWSGAANAARYDERFLREDINNKIQELVGADSIEIDGAFFSGDSDETVQAILRKVGAKNGAAVSEWSLSPYSVKYETIRAKPRPSEELSEPDKSNDGGTPAALLIFVTIMIGLVVILASVAGGGQ